ncbi:MAG: hypothetical protein ACFFD4_08120 [Candidatus Odinarchaeota archaeon]
MSLQEKTDYYQRIAESTRKQIAELMEKRDEISKEISELRNFQHQIFLKQTRLNGQLKEIKMEDIRKEILVWLFFIGIASGWIITICLVITVAVVWLISWQIPLSQESRFYLFALLVVASISARLDILIGMKLIEKDARKT